MSVKELKLTTDNCDFEIETVLDCFRIGVVTRYGYKVVYIDHSQAHSLMLYLQEHLK